MLIQNERVSPIALNERVLIEKLFNYYRSRLKHNAIAVQFLEKAGLDTNAEFIQQNFGVSDRTLGDVLPDPDMEQGHKVRGTLQRLGLLKETGHELFRGALVYSVRNDKGEIIHLYGRMLRRVRRPKSRFLEWHAPSARRN